MHQKAFPCSSLLTQSFSCKLVQYEIIFWGYSMSSKVLLPWSITYLCQLKLSKVPNRYSWWRNGTAPLYIPWHMKIFELRRLTKQNFNGNDMWVTWLPNTHILDDLFPPTHHPTSARVVMLQIVSDKMETNTVTRKVWVTMYITYDNLHLWPDQ